MMWPVLFISLVHLNKFCTWYCSARLLQSNNQGNLQNPEMLKYAYFMLYFTIEGRPETTCLVSNCRVKCALSHDVHCFLLPVLPIPHGHICLRIQAGFANVQILDDHISERSTVRNSILNVSIHCMQSFKWFWQTVFEILMFKNGIKKVHKCFLVNFGHYWSMG